MEAKLKVMGIVRIHEIFVPVDAPLPRIEELVRRGHARKLVETSNLITDVGLQIIAARIANGLGVHSINGNGYGPTNIENLRINKMHLTTAGAPAAPTPADVGLSAATAWSFHDTFPASGFALLSSVQLGTPGQVRFSGLMPPQENAGTIYTEEGLMTDDLQLFARTTFSYEKSENVAVQFDHDIILSRV